MPPGYRRTDAVSGLTRRREESSTIPNSRRRYAAQVGQGERISFRDPIERLKAIFKIAQQKSKFRLELVNPARPRRYEEPVSPKFGCPDRSR
jgi:hypothetical protein